ncbi:hypothetical protein RJT34_17224 [Clitoria ternatea]|uniref:Uncharacterized protein n=1 Tax=Clitoria ternatea TaxID=43366 RepID=A0AAN9PCY4_CLITE
MTEETPPTLYTNKPRKAQLKHLRGQDKPNAFSSPAAMGTHGHPAAAPPPPPPPKEPFVRRYKFLWPMLLVVNLGVGVYLFTRTKKKDTSEEAQDVSPVPTKDATAHVAETAVSTPSISKPVIKREPIPENQQRELLKWILEEKRKAKPKDAEEKQKIDAEKALLKNLIRSKSIPNCTFFRLYICPLISQFVICKLWAEVLTGSFWSRLMQEVAGHTFILQLKQNTEEGKNLEEGDDDDGWMHVVGFIEFHMKARGHPTATAKGKERRDAIIQCATTIIMPFCGDFFYSVI